MIRTLVWIALAFGMYVFAVPAQAASYAPKQVANAAQICVERFEDTGFVNILPIDIAISGSQIVLVGGEAGCIFFPTSNTASKVAVSLTFPYPNADGGSPPSDWTTPKQLFLVKQNEVLSFELCEAEQDHNDPQWAVNGWHDMWLLRRADDRSAPRCAEEIFESEVGQ